MGSLIKKNELNIFISFDIIRTNINDDLAMHDLSTSFLRNLSGAIARQQIKILNSFFIYFKDLDLKIIFHPFNDFFSYFVKEIYRTIFIVIRRGVPMSSRNSKHKKVKKKFFHIFNRNER